MTEEEKERLRTAKTAVTYRLLRIDASSYGLEEVDPRLDRYVSEVVENPEGHNLYEQLAVERFLGLCRKYGLNVGEIRRFYTLYEGLYFPGKAGETRYKLTPVQAFQFASIYGFWKDGKRITRKALLFVPRKFSKTTSSAAFAVDDVLFGDANAESYTCANSADQAKKCFNVIRRCFVRLDPSGKRYTINKMDVTSRRPDRIAFAQCLTSNASTKDGLSASTIIMDEFSQSPDAELYNVLTSSMGVRDNPLTIIITTASDKFGYPFYDMLNGFKALLLGEYEDDSVFAHIFEPDVDDADDDPATWRKVHPHLGITVSEEFYHAEYKTALRDGAEAMLAFRTKLLNRYAQNVAADWISANLARKISRPFRWLDFPTRPPGVVAIDLSESDDFSAVTLGLYDERAKRFYFYTRYFFPEGALPTHPNAKLYRRWAEGGYLQLTPGDVIDYAVVVDYILSLDKRMRVLRVGYDRWKSLDVVNMLSSKGGRDLLTPVAQTYGNFTAPVEAFEHYAKTGGIVLDDNPINAYCFGNAVLDEDKLENKKPIKRKPSAKIDGVITTLMCLRLFMDYER